MSKQSKSIVSKILTLLISALFLMAVTGCCPGGPGCDWYSGDNETQQKKDDT